MKRTIYKKPCKSRPKVNRSVKDRPRNAAELIHAIDSDRLDQRTAPAKRITALKQALTAAPIKAAVAVIRDALAVDLAIAQVLVAEITKPGFAALLPGHKLNPVLDLWRDLQRSLIYSAQTLARMEGQAAPDKASTSPNKATSSDALDVAALIRAAAGESD